MSTPANLENVYRRFYALTRADRDVGDQGFEHWMKTNRMAFKVLNPATPQEQFEPAFTLFMFDTYDGQAASA